MYDILIIGTGPAGLTAGIYAYRTGLNVMLIGDIIGGQLSESPLVENYPGIQEASGPDIANKFMDQYIHMGGKFELDRATEVRIVEGGFEVETEYSGTMTAKALIFATGAEHIHAKLEGDQTYGGNIHYCALCDGPLYKGKDVAVLGSGNSGAQYAIELASYCKSVTICEKADKLFCDKALQDKIKKNRNIKVILGTTAVRCEGDGAEMKHLILEDGTKVKAAGVFVAIGQKPATKLIKKAVKTDIKGFVKADADMCTDVPGLFVAGDCRVKKVRQCTTAVADGAIAATSAAAYLKTLE